MTGQDWGTLIWLALIVWALVGRKVKAGARTSTAPVKATKAARVSRNPQPARVRSGAAWEQDEPMPECFDVMDDEDL